jgi:hypothetical protein
MDFAIHRLSVVGLKFAKLYRFDLLNQRQSHHLLRVFDLATGEDTTQSIIIFWAWLLPVAH